MTLRCVSNRRKKNIQIPKVSTIDDTKTQLHISSQSHDLPASIRDSRGHGPFGGPGTGLRSHHLQPAEHLEEYTRQQRLWVPDRYHQGPFTGMFVRDWRLIFVVGYSMASFVGLANLMCRFQSTLTSMLNVSQPTVLFAHISNSDYWRERPFYTGKFISALSALRR